ncbi:MAG: TonB-dependent receptor, partial [Proteobacteria bacterium]|nr:TonB-dependent receptor [Pseudomonadota bacterium]
VPVPLLANGDDYILETHAKDEQIAAYGEATYNITDAFKATVGARFSRSKFTNDSYTAGPQLFLSPQTVSTSASENAFTPKVSLAYQMDPRNMFYFTYSKGFRPGGANNPVPQAACAEDFANFHISSSPATFNSDTVQSFELGAKNNIANRVRLASSVYYIKWNNIQQTVIPPICQISWISNLGKAEAKGVDVQADVSLTDAITLEIAAGYTDARYTQDSRLSSVVAPVVAKGDAIMGQSGQPASPVTASVGAEYRFRLVERDAFLRLDYQYQGRARWPGASQDPDTLQYDSANFVLSDTNFFTLRGGVTLGDWQVAAFVDNLTDARMLTNYNYSIDPGTGASRLQRAQTFRPRTFGLTFTYRH